ncbi:uncharacterized protein FIBRA_05839 [Fibroporia radiculosa]|uniref:Transferase n=1 Tax=Fibroporia radiculosa TaxID=599839 RepID=J4H3R3_9APHY|nr:uncharacterized protein FIBRA_05839 [Fibroporia radiculosa]CCM03694.1 predicted protein [Fibroporia radiculosa]
MLANSTSATLDVFVHSRSRIFPRTRPDQPQTVPLSIADSSVVRFTTTATVLFYDAQGTALLPEQLESSLKVTLDSYPQWAGQLEWAPYRPDGDHTERVGRVNLSYGTPSDPGVELVVASSPKHLAEFVPSPLERRSGSKCWNAGATPITTLLPDTDLPLHDLTNFRGLPGLMVQATSFACGAVAIAVKMAHALADAHTLARFTSDWAAVNRAMVAGAPVPILSPVFDPSLLDRAAAGDIDAASPDTVLVERSRALPMHRYDWWTPTTDSPPDIPPGLEPTSAAPPGDPIPFADFDTGPSAHYLLHFTADEVRRMWEEARGARAISRQDALFAHVWMLINRARGLEADGAAVHLNIMLGMRARLAPPLPVSFVGSPLTIARVSMPACEASSGLGTMAERIRATVALFDAPALAALLHDMAHDPALVRTWRACLGRRNVVITSWARLGMYEVDFGSGALPRYVEAVIPSTDGCVHIMEAAPTASSTDGGRLKHWCDDGVDVSLYIAADVAERVLRDPMLRQYSDR